MPETPQILITISRAGRQYGPYTLEQVTSFLESGNLVPDDLAYDEQTSSWVPLAELVGRRGVALPPPPPPRKRQAALLILMAIVWTVVLFMVIEFMAGFIAGAVAGARDPNNSAAAGREAGRWIGHLLALPALVAAIVLSTSLTIAGKLPGTKK